MAKNSDNVVQYRATNSVTGNEHVALGNRRSITGQRCARLVRYGRAITDFMISPGQIKALAKGKRINITRAMIDYGSSFICSKADGSLAGPRGRKRRR